MFDFSKIGIEPRYTTGYKAGVTDKEIVELEKYCGYKLPENYKKILINHNGSWPSVRFFNAIDESIGVPGEWKFGEFYYLDKKNKDPGDIWRIIEKYSEFMGPSTLPFADDGLDQIYYMKWINDVPQIWFLAYLDLEEPETYFVMQSFDELLGALHSSRKFLIDKLNKSYYSNQLSVDNYEK